MSVRLHCPVLRLTLFIGGTVLLALGLTACAASPSTPISVSVVVGETAMPGMDMPETPETAMPGMDMPETPATAMPGMDMPEMPATAMPGMDMPEMPATAMPGMDMPEMPATAMPGMDMPEMPATAMPGMDMPGMSRNSYRVEVVFESAVVAGNNQVTVRVHDAVTGEPLRSAVVRVAVNKRAHVEAATDNRDKHMDSYGDAMADSHDGADTASHGDANTDNHDNSGTKSPQAVETNAGHEVAGASHDDAPPAVVTLGASSIPGEHIGQVSFPDVGEWFLTVHFAAEGDEKEAEVAVTAVRDEGRMIALGGFLGLNIVIVATAAITKRKTVLG